ncbi:hypothetical protein CgunFtcFv8_023254 [Champsocephalus gunnari]|uniref:Uncharacterized protein n=1 Tax=Champsocephalus gunnari TaxID=52237 RepID=A0AAN8DC05_CHAGU|nr:hypothetical protein CgunFtcFv8_023254 [Champsocephalus gunnari]
MQVADTCTYLYLSFSLPASVAICCVNRYHTDTGSPWLRVGESVQYLCLAVNLACVADGLDWTEPCGPKKSGSAQCDLDLTGDHLSQVALGPS